ncbi:MAG: hypothetical protein LBH21_08030 [Gracilibacteraceae bacterium]|jgi:hypothetical protein|nr:hypothetical protein [Gracilibacteraceae bacterium]
MLLGIIIACEILFWLFLLAGLAVRYLLPAPKAGMVLLMLTPVADIVLLAAAGIDLRGGAEPSFAHLLAAIYLGMSLVYGKRIITWTDERFAFRFAGGPAPKRRPKTGAAHAAAERRGWLRHLLMFAISCAVMAVLVLAATDDKALNTFLGVAKIWAVVLFADFLISFSYTLFPRKERDG